MSNAWLMLRSLFWVAVLPGLVAGYIPWRYFGVGRHDVDYTSITGWLAIALIAIGLTLLLTCVWEFAHSGRGTLSPADAPRELVVQGLYRYVRNPMYVGVAITLIGEVVLARSTALLIYFAAFFVVVNIFVIAYEEPELRRRFGSSYDDYTRRVNRWIPQIPRAET